MKKSPKINLDEVMDDTNELLGLLERLENINLNEKNVKKLEKDVKIIEKKMKDKYKNLDTQK